jgi:hypothetical protein
MMHLGWHETFLTRSTGAIRQNPGLAAGLAEARLAAAWRVARWDIIEPAVTPSATAGASAADGRDSYCAMELGGDNNNNASVIRAATLGDYGGGHSHWHSSSSSSNSGQYQHHPQQQQQQQLKELPPAFNVAAQHHSVDVSIARVLLAFRDALASVAVPPNYSMGDGSGNGNGTGSGSGNGPNGNGMNNANGLAGQAPFTPAPFAASAPFTPAPFTPAPGSERGGSNGGALSTPSALTPPMSAPRAPLMPPPAPSGRYHAPGAVPHSPPATVPDAADGCVLYISPSFFLSLRHFFSFVTSLLPPCTCFFFFFVDKTRWIMRRVLTDVHLRRVLGTYVLIYF